MSVHAFEVADVNFVGRFSDADKNVSRKVHRVAVNVESFRGEEFDFEVGNGFENQFVAVNFFAEAHKERAEKREKDCDFAE